MKLPERIVLESVDAAWLNRAAVRHHYMHRAVHPRSIPFGWRVCFDGKLEMNNECPAGFIIFASIHYTRLRGEFGYPGLPTKWQVLSLARLWLHDDLPRNSETVVIKKALKAVQRRWIEIHPPPFPDEPYHIRKVISYADTTFHAGTIYRAANFREYGLTKSAKRHKGSRGPGTGSVLRCFIYDLAEPRWKFQPAQLPLLELPSRQ